MPAGKQRSVEDQEAFFARTLLDHPWVDPAVPPLVHEEDGRVVGFVGSLTRRYRLGEEPVKAAWCAHLVADPTARNRAVGALLLGRFLAGAQDVSFSDTATPLVEAMWSRLGGETAHLRCLKWTWLIRPAFAGLALVQRRGAASRAAIRLVGPALRATSRAGARKGPPGAGEPLGVADYLDNLASLTKGRSLVPDYDERYLEWLFATLDDLGDAPVVRRVVRRRSRVIGWYVFLDHPGGISRVLQFLATPSATASVFAQMVDDAASRGAAALRGRMEPALTDVVATRRCVLHVGDRMLVHSRRPGIIEAIATGRALLTSLEGEWI
jgi:hypothetical protein